MTETKKWGGARTGAGRKKGVPVKDESERRSARIVVMATAAQAEALKKAAEVEGLSVSSYLLKKAFSEAKK